MQIIKSEKLLKYLPKIHKVERVDTPLPLMGIKAIGDIDSSMAELCLKDISRSIKSVMVNGCAHHKHFDCDIQPVIDNGRIYKTNIMYLFNGYRMYYNHYKDYLPDNNLVKVDILMRNDLNKLGYYDGINMEHTLEIYTYPNDFTLILSKEIRVDKGYSMDNDSHVTYITMGCYLQPAVSLRGIINIKRN